MCMCVSEGGEVTVCMCVSEGGGGYCVHVCK